MMEDLSRLGYKVFPMISDSFAGGGEFLTLFGNSHNREYRQELERQHTKTMARGELWTSGAPLLEANGAELLKLAVENGFGSVTITFHGLLNERLELSSHENYPIKGVFPGVKCVEVIGRISDFNYLFTRETEDAGLQRPLEINIGVTIGAHNCASNMLRRYVEFFNRLPVSVLRFNCFHDHGWKHPQLVLSPEQVSEVYRTLKDIHEHTPLGFQLGIDEDFGTSGIEVMGFPSHTGWCRAGRQLFAIVPEPPSLWEETPKCRVEAAGTIAACVDAFKPIVGKLIRTTDKASHKSFYDLIFFRKIIEELNRKRLDGTYSDGCFAGELLEEMRPVPAQTSQQYDLRVHRSVLQ
jgi:hypothetical protein